MQSVGAYAHIHSPELALKQAEADFSVADANGDKLLDEYEFLRFFALFEEHILGVMERRRRAETAFQKFDTDHSGFIDLGEFWAAVNELGLVKHMAPSAAQASTQAEFAKLCDQAARMSIDSFCNFYLNAEQAAQAEFAADGRARAHFQSLDVAGVGYITKDQFWTVMQVKGLFEGLTMEQAIVKVNEEFPLADIDNSGMLSEMVRLSCRALSCCRYQVAHPLSHSQEFVRWWNIMEKAHTLRRHEADVMV